MKLSLFFLGALISTTSFVACSGSDGNGANGSPSGDAGGEGNDGSVSVSGNDGGGGSDSGTSDGGGAGPRVLLGVYSDSFQTLNAAIAAASGRNLAIENQRETWGSDMKQADETYDLANGVIPLLSWAVAYKDPTIGNTCASYPKIMRGDYDDSWPDSKGNMQPGLNQEADTVKSWGKPVLIRFYKEFTNTADDDCFYGTGHPASNPQMYGPMLVGIWQHVVDLFKKRGVTNVQWVWGPSAGLFGSGATPDDTTWRYFWPGSNYVDWISNDNYDKSDTDAGSYADDPNITNWYAVTSTLGKPLMQAETGAGYAPDAGVDPMDEWLTTAYATVKNDRPAMKAFLWWSSQGQVDYNLQGQALADFETMAKDPIFQAFDTSSYSSSAGASGGPTAPTNVSAAWSGSDVNVTWTASTDAHGTITAYDVYRDGMWIGTSTTTSYTDSGPSKAGGHIYAVDAIDSAMNRSPESAAPILNGT